MKMLASVLAVLAAGIVGGAQELPSSPPHPSGRIQTNNPASAATNSYARELADKLVERKRMEALEALIPPEDWRPRLAVPPAPSSRSIFHEQWKTNSYDHELAEKLKQSKVPTGEDAKRAAMRTGVAAYEAPTVSALLRLAKADEKLGQAGDFVWEVRITWGLNITGLVWVGASTGQARVLYRP